MHPLDLSIIILYLLLMAFVGWFVAKKAFSSGVVEGLNGKAKVTTRNAYGFRTFKTLEIALYHSLGALPQPEFTHRFF